MTDILKKPVHAALIPLTHIQELHAKGKLPKNAVSLEAPSQSNLPERQTPTHSIKIPRTGASDLVKKDKIRARLRVVYDKLPSLTKAKKPPCDTCVNSPCCKAFIVELTRDEYESGLFEKYAVKITEETRQQLRSNLGTAILSLRSPNILVSKDESFLLEGAIGEPCPFLSDTNKCTIYDHRPLVCRTYSCVGDKRITEEMRTGRKEKTDG